MKIENNFFNWSKEKNILLKKERDIGFEDVILAIFEDRLLDIIEHPNQQKIFVVEIYHYIYLVPFIKKENEIFLKTIIPSRKATKKYLY